MTHPAGEVQPPDGDRVFWRQFSHVLGLPEPMLRGGVTFWLAGGDGTAKQAIGEYFYKSITARIAQDASRVDTTRHLWANVHNRGLQLVTSEIEDEEPRTLSHRTGEAAFWKNLYATVGIRAPLQPVSLIVLARTYELADAVSNYIYDAVGACLLEGVSARPALQSVAGRGGLHLVKGNQPRC